MAGREIVYLMRVFKAVAGMETEACTVAVANAMVCIYKYTLIHRPRF